MKKPLVLGKYLLLERVNIGGMAEVFIAKTFGVRGFEQILAVKKILPTMAEDEEFIKMFIDEARVSVQLNHPNIVHIHDLDGKDDSYYIVMEYVSGRDLRSVLERFRRRKETIPVPMAAYIASKMCEGLDYAHRKKDVKGMDLNIVHRDVSPQNILLGYEGEVKIIDFGIARTEIRSTRTEVGVIKGKFGYMSPEQAYGLPVDRRSDVFAAAVILYEMLTGEKLFISDSDISTLEKVRNADFLPPRQINASIPPELESVLLRALQREADHRYAWASDFHEALEPFTFTDDGKFSPKRLSQTLKDMFADEYTRESNKLKHYATLGAPEVLLPEPAPPPRPNGNGNGYVRTPTPPKPPPFVPDAETTQIVPAEYWDSPEAAYPPAQASPLASASSERLNAPDSPPIQLLSGVRVYTGETMVGKEAGNLLSHTMDMVAPPPSETAKNIAAISITGTFPPPADIPPPPPVDAAPPSASAARLRAWLYVGLSLLGLLTLAIVLPRPGASPGKLDAPSGRLVAVSMPPDVPLELILKSHADESEQRFVSNNEVLDLPAGAYHLQVNSMDERFHVPNKEVAFIQILAGEDTLVPVALETGPPPKTTQVATVGTPGAIPGATPGTPATVPGATPGTPATVPGATPGTPATVPGATPGTPATVPGATPGTPVTVPPGTAASGTPSTGPKAGTAKPPTASAESFVLELGELLDGTQVFIGSELKGTTPALKTLSLPMRGTHNLRLRKPGFAEFSRKIQNTTQEKNLRLSGVLMRPLPPSQGPASAAASKKRGKLVASTVPAGAEVWVDGKKTPRLTPINPANPLLLPEGKHTVVFKVDRKQSSPIPIDITADNVTWLRGIPIE